MGDREYIAKLKEENLELLLENEALRKLLRPVIDLPREWPLTPGEAKVMRVLITHDVATVDMLMAALYIERPDPPGIKVIDVHLSRIRKKLSDYGVQILHVKGGGWFLDQLTRARFTTPPAAAGGIS